MTWTKQPALKDALGGCGTCDRPADVFPMDGMIAVGFGSAGISRDGLTVVDGEERAATATSWEDFARGADAEALAAADPDHDWRIFLHGPLSDRVYQRHAPEQWVLIERGQGFA